MSTAINCELLQNGPSRAHTYETLHNTAMFKCFELLLKITPKKNQSNPVDHGAQVIVIAKNGEKKPSYAEISKYLQWFS